jgi:hypothetical protein
LLKVLAMSSVVDWDSDSDSDSDSVEDWAIRMKIRDLMDEGLRVLLSRWGRIGLAQVHQRSGGSGLFHQRCEPPASEWLWHLASLFLRIREYLHRRLVMSKKMKTMKKMKSWS